MQALVMNGGVLFAMFTSWNKMVHKFRYTSQQTLAGSNKYAYVEYK